MAKAVDVIASDTVLRVSYGTLRLRIEGFDAPFDILKAIGDSLRPEPGRDGTAAGPSMPDLPALLGIAERLSPRPVTARIEGRHIVLHAQTAPPGPRVDVRPDALAPHGADARRARHGVAAHGSATGKGQSQMAPDPDAGSDPGSRVAPCGSAEPCEPSTIAHRCDPSAEHRSPQIAAILPETVECDGFAFIGARSDFGRRALASPRAPTPPRLVPPPLPPDTATAEWPVAPARPHARVVRLSRPVEQPRAPSAALQQSQDRVAAAPDRVDRTAPPARFDVEIAAAPPCPLAPAVEPAVAPSAPTLPRSGFEERPDRRSRSSRPAPPADDPPQGSGPVPARVGDAPESRSVGRLIAQANAEMEETGNRRRMAAIAHLKAAVASTRAERDAGIPRPGTSKLARTTPYRSDLDLIVSRGGDIPSPPTHEPKAVTPASALGRGIALRASPDQAEDVAMEEGKTDAPLPCLILDPDWRVDMPRSCMAAGLVGGSRGEAAAPKSMDCHPEESVEGERCPDTADTPERVGFGAFAAHLDPEDLATCLAAAVRYGTLCEERGEIGRARAFRHVASLTRDRIVPRRRLLDALAALLRSGDVVENAPGRYRYRDPGSAGPLRRIGPDRSPHQDPAGRHHGTRI